jgi:hypothetical protein
LHFFTKKVQTFIFVGKKVVAIEEENAAAAALAREEARFSLWILF